MVEREVDGICYEILRVGGWVVYGWSIGRWCLFSAVYGESAGMTGSVGSFMESGDLPGYQDCQAGWRRHGGGILEEERRYSISY